MPYIKKLVMHGFKSFAKGTEIPFDKGLNTIIGPNGAGKSNITDAICFVFGRMSMKSIRAENSAALIYDGGKNNKPASDARVDLVIDNSDKVFARGDEIAISRIVRKDGQSIYKIDNETKTRQEVLDLLSQAGIDPYGFNIILQNEIISFVLMHGEERRKIIEDIAGISVYEEKKEKSLHELEKTDEQLKLVNATLHERFMYLKNLDKERQQALRYQELQRMIARDKASLIAKGIKEKNQDKERIEKQCEESRVAFERVNAQINKTKEEISSLNQRIDSINKEIQLATGVQQESLHKEIVGGRANLAALSVRIENNKQQLVDIETRNSQLEKDIEQEKRDIVDLKALLPEQEKIGRLLKEKTERFNLIQEKHKNLNELREELSNLRITLQSNKRNHSKIVEQLALIKQRIEGISTEIRGVRERIGEIDRVKKRIEACRNELLELEKNHAAYSDELSKGRREVEIIERFRKSINEMDICPICKRRIEEQHKHLVNKNSDADIKSLSSEVKKAHERRESLSEQISKLRNEIEALREEHSKLHIARIHFDNLKEREGIEKSLDETRLALETEIAKMERRERGLESSVNEFREVEEGYEGLKREIESLSAQQIDKAQLQMKRDMKAREVERMQVIISKSKRDYEEIEGILAGLESEFSEQEDVANRNEKAEKEAYAKFEQLFAKRNKIQDDARKLEFEMISRQSKAREYEDGINSLRIVLAGINASLSTLDMELKQFGDVEIAEASRNELEARIKRHGEDLAVIGSVNMRALQVYDNIKKEYDEIETKTLKLEQEKMEVLKIIEEIDKRKRKEFIKTLDGINALFARNFTQLSDKGQAFLDLENKEEPFAGGLDILVRIAKGKYQSIPSLSGGEKVFLALSLIFAIQEYKPYWFYVLDEIDAALDKRNSEILASLLKRYMQNAQYIMITHNDSMMSEAPVLYGVTKQDGVSKVISLKI